MGGSGGARLARARAAAAQALRRLGLPGGPVVLGLLEDAPLLGTLGNLYAAVGALGLAREAALPAVLCLLPGRPRPLYTLGRDGEIRRISLEAAPGGLPAERRCAVALLGALQAASGRPWPLAHLALEQAWRQEPAGGELLGAWALQLWRAVARPFGAAVLHAGLPPAAGALAELRAALEPLEAAPPPAPGRGAPSRTGLLPLLHALQPVAAVCAGEAEAAQLTALGPAVERLAAAAPLVRPRPRFTLLTPAEAGFARVHGAPLQQGPEALRRAGARALLRAGAPAVGAAVAELRRAADQALGQLERAVALEAPRAAGVLPRRAGRVRRGIEALGEELAGRLRAEQRAAARAWRHLEHALYPLGQDQDDWLAAYPWVAAAAGELVARLLAEPAPAGRRWLCWPERPSPLAARPAVAAAGRDAG